MAAPAQLPGPLPLLCPRCQSVHTLVRNWDRQPFCLCCGWELQTTAPLPLVRMGKLSIGR